MFKKVSVVCLIVYLCAMFSSCADFDETSKPLPTTTSPIITRYGLKELKQNTIEVSEKTLTDLDIVTEHDKFVLLNNKKDQFYPYKDGYIYPIEKGGKDRFGVLDLSTNQIGTFNKVRSNEYSLGTGIIINGKYIYYTDPDLKRLNIEDNSVEEVLNKNVVSMGFVDNKIICCTNSAIYLVSDKGAKRLKTPLMKDEFFSNIAIDGKKVFVETQAGAFFWRVRQIDLEGNVIMKVYSS